MFNITTSTNSSSTTQSITEQEISHVRPGRSLMVGHYRARGRSEYIQYRDNYGGKIERKCVPPKELLEIILTGCTSAKTRITIIPFQISNDENLILTETILSPQSQFWMVAGLCNIIRHQRLAVRGKYRGRCKLGIMFSEGSGKTVSQTRTVPFPAATTVKSTIESLCEYNLMIDLDKQQHTPPSSAVTVQNRNENDKPLFCFPPTAAAAAEEMKNLRIEHHTLVTGQKNSAIDKYQLVAKPSR